MTRRLLVTALLGAAVCVPLGAATSSAERAGDADLPRLDRKPHLQSIAVDKHKGRDRVVVVATYDNPLNTDGVTQSAVDPAEVSHRGRVDVVLKRGGKRIAAVRARQDLEFRSSGETHAIPFAIALPRRVDGAITKTGPDQPPVRYEVEMVHVLEPAGAVEDNDRAESTASGELDAETAQTPVRAYYANSDYSVEVNVVLDVPRPYVVGLDVDTPRCGTGQRLDHQSYHYNVQPGYDAQGAPTSGYVDSNLEFDAEGVGGWGWISMGYDPNPDVPPTQSTDGRTGFRGKFTNDGSHVTLTAWGYSWQQPFGPPPFPFVKCTFPRQTWTLAAAG